MLFSELLLWLVMLRLLQIKDQETEDHAGNVAKTKKKQV